MPIYVIGHKNPDTDSVASAIAYADLKKKEGIDAVPVVAGKINKGTKLVLDKFGVEEPKIMDFHKLPDAKVILVDHNEAAQRADGMVKEHVIEVIDHHRFGDFSSAEPIYIQVLPWGSTASIITRMYQDYNHVPEKHIAGLLLSAILTDTLGFNSPTTTPNDMAMAEWLNEIAEIDMKDHAAAIFRAKSDISDMSAADVIKKDYKEYHFNGKINMAVAVFETVDSGPALTRKEELLLEIARIKKERKLDYLLFAVIDIVKKVAYMLVVTPEEEALVKKVFKKGSKESVVELPGILSRKKEMIPAIEEFFAKNG